MFRISEFFICTSEEQEVTKKKEGNPSQKRTEPQGHEPLAQKCDHWRKPECQGQRSTLTCFFITIYVDYSLIGWLCDSSRKM